MNVRVRLLTDRVGLSGYQQWGDIIEMKPEEASRMVATHQAELIETTTRAAPENAARNLKPLKRR